MMTETLSPALPDEIERHAHALLKAACELEITFATAESCTGGLLASLLTDVDGAGRAFDRGFVVYTDQAKAELLGIPIDLIKREGAVSKAVAIAMAEGALARSEADIAISVTGFAGPGGPDDEPGLVHFGCAARGAPTRHLEIHCRADDRGTVRLEAIRAALRMLSAALPGPSSLP